MENNLSKKANEEKIKRRCNHESMSQFVYFISKDYNLFAKKNVIENNVLTKKKNIISFTYYSFPNRVVTAFMCPS
jgi:ABC-type polar amino acid transport system ATPase subunit